MIENIDCFFLFYSQVLKTWISYKDSQVRYLYSWFQKQPSPYLGCKNGHVQSSNVNFALTVRFFYIKCTENMFLKYHYAIENYSRHNNKQKTVKQFFASPEKNSKVDMSVFETRLLINIFFMNTVTRFYNLLVLSPWEVYMLECVTVYNLSC